MILFQRLALGGGSDGHPRHGWPGIVMTLVELGDVVCEYVMCRRRMDVTLDDIELYDRCLRVTTRCDRALESLNCVQWPPLAFYVDN
jgi:hypothetical protein